MKSTASVRSLPQRGRTLLSADDVLGDLVSWRQDGAKATLITLVAIDGSTPRPLGAQMAVAEDGRYSGYLSGGCLETTVANEAVQAMADGKNRLVRYGKGSAYFDLKLPCGSGLDLYFDQTLSPNVLAELSALRASRVMACLSTNLATGESSAGAVDEGNPTVCESTGDVFRRIYVPSPRVLLVGGGPALAAIAQLVSVAGFETDIATPDDEALAEMRSLGLSARGFADAAALGSSPMDRWTAALVAFHDHDWEAPVLAQILGAPCFYVGVMGSKKAHTNRLERLTAMGVAPAALLRIRSPIGLIGGAKSRASLAVGVLAELVQEAKAGGMIA